MPDTVYSTKVSATGGRHGTIRSDDGFETNMKSVSAAIATTRVEIQAAVRLVLKLASVLDNP